jgi:hypothetical protein
VGGSSIAIQSISGERHFSFWAIQFCLRLLSQESLPNILAAREREPKAVSGQRREEARIAINLFTVGYHCFHSALVSKCARAGGTMECH